MPAVISLSSALDLINNKSHFWDKNITSHHQTKHTLQLSLFCLSCLLLLSSLTSSNPLTSFLPL